MNPKTVYTPAYHDRISRKTVTLETNMGTIRITLAHDMPITAGILRRLYRKATITV